MTVSTRMRVFNSLHEEASALSLREAEKILHTSKEGKKLIKICNKGIRHGVLPYKSIRHIIEACNLKLGTCFGQTTSLIAELQSPHKTITSACDAFLKSKRHIALQIAHEVHADICQNVDTLHLARIALEKLTSYYYSGKIYSEAFILELEQLRRSDERLFTTLNEVRQAIECKKLPSLVPEAKIQKIFETIIKKASEKKSFFWYTNQSTVDTALKIAAKLEKFIDYPKPNKPITVKREILYVQDQKMACVQKIIELLSSKDRISFIRLNQEFRFIQQNTYHLHTITLFAKKQFYVYDPSIGNFKIFRKLETLSKYLLTKYIDNSSLINSQIQVKSVSIEEFGQ